jgi:putative ABC transport system permease protein
MIKNYFRTAIRHFRRNFGYTFINIAGLSCGLGATILILLWVNDEVKYDSFHTNGNKLYKVWHKSLYTDGAIKTFPSTPALLATAAKEEIPEIEYAIRMDWGTQLLFASDETSLMQQGIWADPEFFKMFTFPLVQGNMDNPLPDGSSVAISRKLASIYFGDQDPLGKLLKVAEQLDMKVTAVFDNVPSNSSLQFDFVLPFETFAKGRPWMLESWEVSSNQSFVQLKDGASVDDVNAKLSALVKKNCAVCLVDPFLQLFKDSYLYSNFTNGKQDGGKIEYVRAFFVVAIFILLMACINFMNLSTARASTRSREVGVRKVIGAQRNTLVVQFLGESILISAVSMVVALSAVQLILPLFNMLTHKSVVLAPQPGVILILFGIVLLTGLLAGSYPALFLSGFKPAEILKGNLHPATGEAFVRKGLVIFQFSLSTILIATSIVIYNQIEFIRTKNLGLNRDNVLSMDLRGGVHKNLESFKAEALRQPGILGISAVTDLPFNVNNTTSDPIWPGKQKDQVIPFKVIMSDADLIPLLGIELVGGRNFNGHSLADTTNYILNEAAVKAMGIQDPVGSPLEMWFGKGKVIGVVKDFHNQNFRSAIDPLVMAYYPSNAWRLLVKLDGASAESSLNSLEKLYKKFDSVYPFTYSFLDQQFNSEYQNEITTGKLAMFFTCMAVFISSLGLFGLATFTAERRTKELGIRKILGATLPNLVTLLCSDFTKLILISLVIACPAAFFVTQAFLSQYAFHADLTLWIFVMTAAGIFLLALLTVIFQSVKAALSNPVNSLRTE